MKLKYKFVISQIDGQPIAVAVGRDNQRFNGMIKLNTTGVVVFEKLAKGPVTLDEIAADLCARYEVDRDTAVESVTAFISELQKNDLIDE